MIRDEMLAFSGGLEVLDKSNGNNSPIVVIEVVITPKVTLFGLESAAVINKSAAVVDLVQELLCGGAGFFVLRQIIGVGGH